MAFAWGKYIRGNHSNTPGGTGICVNQYSWFPDGSNWVYDSITYWYQWAFKRNAEAGGTYYWYSVFTNPAPHPAGNSFVDGGTGFSSTYHTPLFLFIYNAGVANGEYGINHQWLGAGTCPIYGCTDPVAENTCTNGCNTDDGSCTYIWGCMDPSATNYNPAATRDNGQCNYTVYGCMDTTANNYNSNANVNQGCTYDQPTASLSASPGSIIAGQSSTLTWNTNYAVSGTISPINYSISPVSSGTKVVNPSTNTTYTLNVNGVPNGGKTASATTSLTVYTPPQTNISLTSSSIPVGSSTTLSWATTGDASSATINQGIGSVPLSSNTTVSPTSTTTYTISVSGSGGSDSDSVTLTVVPAPTCSISASPDPLPYGTNVTLTYDSSNATVATLYRYYTIDGVITQMTTTSLNVNQNTTVTDTIDWANTYNGTVSTLDAVKYTISVTNGVTTQTATTPTISTLSDMMPDLIAIPPSGPLPPDDEPVISPETETNALLVDDIDLPVEIKADYPIKVEIDDSGTWQNVRSISGGGGGGNQTTVSGQQAYTTPGTYNWTAPANVYDVAVVAVGGGGGGDGDDHKGGGGGGLGWKNGISVMPNQSYTVVVGAAGEGNNSGGTDGGDSYFIDTTTVKGGGGKRGTGNGGDGGDFVGDGGGNGGAARTFGGGGGAGGYSGDGNSETGGAAGWGSANGLVGGGAGGGGVGILGEGASGSNSPINNTYGGTMLGGGGGSGGNNGTNGTTPLNDGTYYYDAVTGGPGGDYGGGAGGVGTGPQNTPTNLGGAGGKGAVRIIWGNGRAFPSTLTADV